MWSTVSIQAVIQRLRLELADPLGKTWPDALLRDRIYDFVLWAMDIRPELFVVLKDIEVTKSGIQSCCIRFEYVEAETDDKGNIVEQYGGVNNSALDQIPYGRRMCAGGGIRRQIDIVGQAKNAIRIVPPLADNEVMRLRVWCVARPEMSEAEVRIPSLLEPYLVDYVVAKALGDATDEPNERAASAERIRALKRDIIDGKNAQAVLSGRVPRKG